MNPKRIFVLFTIMFALVFMSANVEAGLGSLFKKGGKLVKVIAVGNLVEDIVEGVVDTVREIKK